MSWLTIVALVLVLISLFLVIMRIFGSGGVQPISRESLASQRSNVMEGRLPGGLDSAYQEVLNLGDVQLDNTEIVLAGCGRRGEVEQVLLATSHKLYMFVRRFGASRYSYDTFDYAKLHPIPVSQAVIGERIRLLEGDRMAEMESPGAESWLDTAEDTIKVVNDRIRKSRTNPPK